MSWSPRLVPGLTLASILACLVACSAAMSEPSSPSRTDADVLDARRQAFERKQLQAVPEETGAAVVGEVPEAVMTDVRKHLAGRTGGDADAFEVVRAQEHEWPDGAMGCPQPGLIYTQRPIQGYWIVLRHDGRDYDYRVSRAGMLVLCEAMVLEDPPLG